MSNKIVFKIEKSPTMSLQDLGDIQLLKNWKSWKQSFWKKGELQPEIKSLHITYKK